MFLASTEIEASTPICLAALYLAGLAPSGVARPSAPAVENLLRRRSVRLENAWQVLRSAGFAAEAAALQAPGALLRAASLYETGKVVTTACAAYPAGWRQLPAPPPAVWCSSPPFTGQAIGIAGTREPCPEAAAFAAEVALEARRLGFHIVSGGAPGCDTLAAQAVAGRLIEILPCGIDVPWGHPEAVKLSVRHPSESFSTAAAMERNLLIYAFAGRAVVCDARFKTGGSWHGAREALRRNVSQVVVREDASSLALRALVALGGVPLKCPSSLTLALVQPPLQPSLRLA